MTVANTSKARVESLVDLSEKVYPTIDSRIDDETRARLTLRLGIQAAAHATGNGLEYLTKAGTAYMSTLQQNLAEAGIDQTDYQAWPKYQQALKVLPDNSEPEHWHHQLDTLAKRYADVKRATIASDGSFETNASHVVHLSALAIPYAAEYHPNLHLPTVALYLLLHDIVEAYAGDTPSLGLTEDARRAKDQREQAAMLRIHQEFSDKFPELVASCQDYESLASDEAKFVKAFDKLDPSFTHLANHCLALRQNMGIDSADKFLELLQHTTDSMTYAKHLPKLMGDRQTLLQKIADETPWHEKIPA